MPIATRDDYMRQSLECPIEPVSFTLRLRVPENRELDSVELFLEGCVDLTDCRSAGQHLFMSNSREWLVGFDGANIPAAIAGVRRAFTNSGGLR